MRHFKMLFFLACMTLVVPVWADTEEPVVEIKGDRTIIYPQRLELNGEETLLDILEMYPDMMAAGFNDLLSDGKFFSDYQLRLDNVVISGDTRLMMTQIKAVDIKKIQVIDNAGVAKGNTDDGRVIDVNLLKAEKGAHGFASLQGATDRMVAPSAKLRYGSEKTTIWSSITYTHSDQRDVALNAERLHFQMANIFSPRDSLQTYVTQSSSSEAHNQKGFTYNKHAEAVMARLRYFHTFNDIGTKLMAMLSWKYEKDPSSITDLGTQIYFNENSHVHNPVWVLEVNTPLFVKNMSLMAGYEGKVFHIRHGSDLQMEESVNFSEESTYWVVNNDVYAQLNYKVGPVLLTLGDRFLHYHYRQYGYSTKWKKNEPHNIVQVSAVYTPHRHHQVQVGYYHKLIHPPLLSVFPELWPDMNGSFTEGNPLLDKTNINQFKLSYNYRTPRLTATLSGSIYRTDTGNHYWTIAGSVYKKFGILSLTGGFNVYHLNMADTPATTFADIRLSPTLHLPHDWQIRAKVIWYSKDAPRRILAENTPVYASLQLNKQLGRHWDLQLQWHDIFYSQRSACLAGVSFHY